MELRNARAPLGPQFAPDPIDDLSSAVWCVEACTSLFSQSSAIMGGGPQGGVSRDEARLRSGVDSREKAPESYPEATESEEKYLFISSSLDEGGSEAGHNVAE